MCVGRAPRTNHRNWFVQPVPIPSYLFWHIGLFFFAFYHGPSWCPLLFRTCVLSIYIISYIYIHISFLTWFLTCCFFIQTVCFWLIALLNHHFAGGTVDRNPRVRHSAVALAATLYRDSVLMRTHRDLAIESILCKKHGVEPSKTWN